MLSVWKQWLVGLVLLIGGSTVVAQERVSDATGVPGATTEDFLEEESDPDPFENFNRAVFRFNDALDRTVLRPVARGYRAITPDIVEQGISNFFSNLGDIPSALNNFLQGDINGMFSDLSRVIINTTVGVGGLIDVASKNGIEKRGDDLGQTFGIWGIESGPYLVLPFIGPSSVRDGVGWAGEFFFVDPLLLVDDSVTYWSLVSLRYVDRRAIYLTATDLADQAALDPYVFYRESYLQKRAADIRGKSALDDF